MGASTENRFQLTDFQWKSISTDRFRIKIDFIRPMRLSRCNIFWVHFLVLGTFFGFVYIFLVGVVHVFIFGVNFYCGLVWILLRIGVFFLRISTFLGCRGVFSVRIGVVLIGNEYTWLLAASQLPLKTYPFVIKNIPVL